MVNTWQFLNGKQASGFFPAISLLSIEKSSSACHFISSPSPATSKVKPTWTWNFSELFLQFQCSASFPWRRTCIMSATGCKHVTPTSKQVTLLLWLAAPSPSRTLPPTSACRLLIFTSLALSVRSRVLLLADGTDVSTDGKVVHQVVNLHQVNDRNACTRAA